MLKSFFLLLPLSFFLFCNDWHSNVTHTHIEQVDSNTIIKVVMKLSAFGVESDDYPNIDASIDFLKDTSLCVKWYFNPAVKGENYRLSTTNILKLKSFLQNVDLSKLKEKYVRNPFQFDLPTSTTKIYTLSQTFTVEDYGLEGEYPLQELYKIVYKR